MSPEERDELRARWRAESGGRMIDPVLALAMLFVLGVLAGWWP